MIEYRQKDKFLQHFGGEIDEKESFILYISSWYVLFWWLPK